MRDIKTCLINLVPDGDYQYKQEIPLGLAALAAFMRSKNYTAELFQGFYSDKDWNFETGIPAGFNVYGFQLTINNFNEILKACKTIKNRDADAKTIIGGPFITLNASDILRKMDEIDFAVIGEGELTLLELIAGIEKGETDFSEVKGLSWKKQDGTVVENGLRALIEDLDTLPFVARDLLDEAKKDPIDGSLMESVRLITSRGCAGNCSFCCVNLYGKILEGKRWRGRSPKHVVDEIESLHKNFGAWLYNFSDSSFEDPGRKGKKRSAAICQELIDRNVPMSAKIYMRCETMRTDDDIDLLKHYKKSGIDVVIVGAEAGSDYELDFYEKPARIEDNNRTLTYLNNLDLFYVLVGFIMFGPNSTLDSLHQNAQFHKKHTLFDNMMHIANTLILIRDSKLYRILKEEGRVIEPENPLQTPGYTFLNPKAEKVAGIWSKTLARYRNALELNQVQVNLGNLVYRLSNRMNSKLYETIPQECDNLKEQYKEIKAEISEMHYKHFIKLLEMTDANADEDKMTEEQSKLFNVDYVPVLDRYNSIYNSFLNRVNGLGFGMTGLVFNHFHSALVITDETKKAG